MICIFLCLLLVESLNSLHTALCIGKGKKKKSTVAHAVLSTLLVCTVSALVASTAALSLHHADKLHKPPHLCPGCANLSTSRYPKISWGLFDHHRTLHTKLIISQPVFLSLLSICSLQCHLPRPMSPSARLALPSPGEHSTARDTML